jgi:hypothetical protein
MPRPSDSIEEIINSAVQRVTSRILPVIQQALAQAAAAGAGRAGPAPRRPARRRRRRPEQELTRWVADRRARRVPTFVIEATGLDTKKKIVAKFGESATFEKGKPLPATRPSPEKRSAPAKASAARVVKAKRSAGRRAAAG